VHRRLSRAACVVALCLCGPGASVAGLNPLAQEMSIEDEKELGAQAHRQIRDHADLVTDPVLLWYLNELGQSVVHVTEPQPFLYRFNLIDDDRLNAFAVPGGYIYIHTAVLQQAGDISELMGVLSHEVAHVRRRHIAESQEKQGMAQLATLIASLGAAIAGAHPGIVQVASGINVALQLKYSRDHEADADRHGIEYMIKTGYDPEGMIHFFQRIEAASAGGAIEIPPYLFSHPAIPERIHAARVEIERVHAPDDLQSDDDRLARMQARLARLSDPVAGGTGLRARPEFDRSIADPVLKRARALAADGKPIVADSLLAKAQEAAPDDPRVPLARADIAEQRGDWPAAAEYLAQVIELDPRVPILQYRLGLAYRRIGDDARAVFFLEAAAANFAPGSSGRRRADLAVEHISFPILKRSGLSDERAGPERARFVDGETAIWWGEVDQRYVPYSPRFRVRWRDPRGIVAHEQSFPIGSRLRVSARFDVDRVAPGEWRLEVSVGDLPVETRRFRIDASSG
jgi:predicted Zn-dependent protease